MEVILNLFLASVVLFCTSCASSPSENTAKSIMVVYDDPKNCTVLNWVSTKSKDEMTSDQIRENLVREASKIEGATHLYINNISVSQGSGRVFSCSKN